MVPAHLLSEMKPNSGRAAAEPGRQHLCVLLSLCDESLSPRVHFVRYTRTRRGIVDQSSEPLPNTARVVKMVGHPFWAAADRKRQAMQIRHDREDALVCDVIANKNRTSPLEGIMRHQFQNT